MLYRGTIRGTNGLTPKLSSNFNGEQRMTNGGGKDAGRELSGRGEAKSLVRLRKLCDWLVYAELRPSPPGRDYAPCATHTLRRDALAPGHSPHPPGVVPVYRGVLKLNNASAR